MVTQLDRRLRYDSAHDLSPDWIHHAHYVAEHSTDPEIAVDISAVEKIGSRELNELIRLHLSVKKDGRRLVLENAQKHLLQVFTETRLDRLIHLRNHQPS